MTLFLRLPQWFGLAGRGTWAEELPGQNVQAILFPDLFCNFFYKLVLIDGICSFNKRDLYSLTLQRSRGSRNAREWSDVIGVQQILFFF